MGCRIAGNWWGSHDTETGFALPGVAWGGLKSTHIELHYHLHVPLCKSSATFDFDLNSGLVTLSARNAMES